MRIQVFHGSRRFNDGSRAIDVHRQCVLQILYKQCHVFIAYPRLQNNVLADTDCTAQISRPSIGEEIEDLLLYS